MNEAIEEIKRAIPGQWYITIMIDRENCISTLTYTDGGRDHKVQWGELADHKTIDEALDAVSNKGSDVSSSA